MQPVDQALASSSTRRADLRGPDRKELLFLQLDELPRRVAENDVEAAAPAGSIGWSGGAEQVRELEVPVEEPILGGESLQSGQRGLGQRLAAREGP